MQPAPLAARKHARPAAGDRQARSLLALCAAPLWLPSQTIPANPSLWAVALPWRSLGASGRWSSLLRIMAFYLLHCRTGPGLWLGRDRSIVCAKFPRGPWLGDIKGSCVRGQRSLSEPQQGTPVGSCEHRALEMRTLFLTVSLSLIAALQAQEPPALGENTLDVRLR